MNVCINLCCYHFFQVIEEEKTTPTESAPEPSNVSEDNVSSDPIAGLHPTVPRDFQIFINLVELCRLL